MMDDKQGFYKELSKAIKDGTGLQVIVAVSILSFRTGLNPRTPVSVNLVGLLFIYEGSTFQF